MVDGRPCTLEILDTAGREEYATFRDQHIHYGDVFVLAYSVTSRSSFSHIRKHYDHIKEIKSGRNLDTTRQQTSPFLLRPCHSPVILIGTKSDLGSQREVSLKEGRTLAKSLNCWFIETSAKYDLDVERTFNDAVRCFRQQNSASGNQTARTFSRARKSPNRLLGPARWMNRSKCGVM